MNRKIWWLVSSKSLAAGITIVFNLLFMKFSGIVHDLPYKLNKMQSFQLCMHKNFFFKTINCKTLLISSNIHLMKSTNVLKTELKINIKVNSQKCGIILYNTLFVSDSIFHAYHPYKQISRRLFIQSKYKLKKKTIKL